MAIAQMNWGRMLFPLEDMRMAEFAASLDGVYRLAELHQGFIWRIPDVEANAQLQNLGFDNMISSTVSIWETIDDLKAYTYETLHGDFIKRKSKWFENVEGPQLVIWNVEPKDRPTFEHAFERLEALKRDGPTENAYGWTT